MGLTGLTDPSAALVEVVADYLDAAQLLINHRSQWLSDVEHIIDGKVSW